MYPRHKVPLSLQTSFGLRKHALSFPFDLCTRRTFIPAPYSFTPNANLRMVTPSPGTTPNRHLI